MKRSKELMKQYREESIKIKRKQNEILEFKKKYAEIFDTMESLEFEIELFDKKQKDILEKLKSQMKVDKISTDNVGKFKFTLVEPNIRRNFDTKKFYEKYDKESKMYKEFVTESDVSDYVKVTEMKILDEDFENKVNE